MPPKNPLRWTDWPVTRSRGRAVFAMVVIVITTSTIASFDPILAVLGAAGLLMVCSEVLLPTRYTLTPTEAFLSNPLYRKRVQWVHIRRYKTIADGFWLEGTGRLRITRHRRALRLRCPGREDTVGNALRAYLQDADTTQ